MNTSWQLLAISASYAGHHPDHADVAKADGHEGVSITKAAISEKAASRDSAAGGEEQQGVAMREHISRERRRGLEVSRTPVSRAEEGAGFSTTQPEQPLAESEGTMTVSQQYGVSQVLRPDREAVSEKGEKQMQGAAKSAEAGLGSNQPSRHALLQDQPRSEAATEAAEGHKARNALAASPAPGRAPPQPASDVGSRNQPAAPICPSATPATQPQKQAPAVLQLAGQGTKPSATGRAPPSSASMSGPAAAKPRALSPQLQIPESKAQNAMQSSARLAAHTVQEKATTKVASQAAVVPGKTAAGTAQQKASHGPVPTVVQAPPKAATPPLQQKKPPETLPKPVVAPQHRAPQSTSIKAMQSPVRTKGQAQQRRSDAEALPKTNQAPAKAAAAAPNNSTAPPVPDRVTAGISKSAPVVKNAAGAVGLAKAPSSAPSNVPVPSARQAMPASSAQAVQAPAKYSFLYPQKEDSKAGKPQRVLNSLAAASVAAPAPTLVPPAQEVHPSRPGGAGASAGGSQRSQPPAGQKSVQVHNNVASMPRQAVCKIGLTSASLPIAGKLQSMCSTSMTRAGTNVTYTIACWLISHLVHTLLAML